MFHALALFFFTWIGSSVSGSQPLVAVMSLEARKVDTSDALTLRDALSNHLIATGEVRVMERAQVEAILREQGFQQSGLCDQNECAVQVGKLLGIDRIVVGSVGKIGETFTVALRMVDVTTGEVLATASRNQRGQIDAVLTDLIPQVAAELVRRKGRPAPVADSPSKGRPLWPWIAGGALIAGGAAAAVLLLSSEETSDPAPQIPVDPAWDATVTW